jgi:dienelactone hydrolase
VRLVDLVGSGPHPVGVRTRTFVDREDAAREVPFDVWYPADRGSLEPDAVPGAHEAFPDPYGPAHLAPDPALGRWPLIAFSHGNSGVRRQSTFLLAHLASWGFAVVSADHVGNTLPETLGQSEDARIAMHREARLYRPRDLARAIECALDDPSLGAHIDALRLGALGHSFGAWSILKLPLRAQRGELAHAPRALCGLAPASEPFVGRSAFEPGELPLAGEVATLLVAGTDDVLVDLDTSVRPLFARLAKPAALIGVSGLDHFHFCNGVEFLHGAHHANPRRNQPRPTRPYVELLPEARTHRLLRALVTSFFRQVLRDEAEPFALLGPDDLRTLDPTLERLG